MPANYLWNNPEEIDNFARSVDQFLKQQIDPERFMAFRLQHGVYGQRQDGVHMVRVKLPGGRIFVDQLPALSHILSDYSEIDHVNVTTRQDLQFHFVRLENTPNVLRCLSEVNLTTREACGNTVRNITSCSLAGVCPHQLTDINQYSEAVAQHFLRHPLTQHLPRKFKMSFSACARDCAMGMMHDVGVVAQSHNGEPSFRLLAGGGLGHKPRPAIVLAEQLAVEELIPAIEAIIALHNRHSDRKRRAKARIKFLLEKFGEDGFRAQFADEFARTKLALADTSLPDTAWREANTQGAAFNDGAPRTDIAQWQTNLTSLPISLPLGKITSAQLNALHRIMQTYGLAELRATSDQNLVLINVPSDHVAAIRLALADAQLSSPRPGDNIIACPGTWTCRLGITSSQAMAEALDNPADLRVRISGCHNSCAQHHVADIGLHGEGNRVQGKLIPSYVIHLGGHATANGQIAKKGPTIPALRAKEAVARISHAYLQEAAHLSFSDWAQSKPMADIDTLLGDLTIINEEQVKELAHDVGDSESFRVVQYGGGECAGATQDHVASNFSEALHERNYCSAFFLQNKLDDALECARHSVRLTAASVLFLAGNKADSDLAAIQSAFHKVLGHHGDLVAALDALCEQLNTLAQSLAADTFKDFLARLDAWINLSAQACQTMDEQLDLASSALVVTPATSQEAIIELDLSTYECPLHYVKARNELKKMPSEQLVKLILENEEAVKQVSLSLKKEGHTILDSEPAGAFMALMVRRRK